MFRGMTALAGFVVFCAGCSTLESEDMTQRAQASVMDGLAACERHLTMGEALATAIAAEAPEAETKADGFNFPGYRTREPSWQLPGMVFVAPEANGGCTVVAYAGSGPAIRNAAVAERLHDGSDWFRIGILAPQPGDERDAVCTVSKIRDGRAFGITMTTAKAGTAPRKFIATSLVTQADQCTSRRM